MVFNSVKDIKDGCNHLLEVSNTFICRYDIDCARKQVTESLSKLVDCYENDSTYDEKAIEQYKKECEKDALNLEYLLRNRCSSINETYCNRNRVHNLLKKLDTYIDNLDKDKDMVRIGLALADRSGLCGIVKKVSHIVFELNGDDYEMMDIIENNLGRDYLN